MRGFALLGDGWDGELAEGPISSQHHSEILHRRTGYLVTHPAKPHEKLPVKAFIIFGHTRNSNTAAKTSVTPSGSPGPKRSTSR